MTSASLVLSRKALPVLVLGTLAFVGCTGEPANTTKTTTQTETKQVGSTAESTTKTTIDTPTGEATAVTKSYVGTVTQYKPGKSIEVMTGDKDTHSFDLDGKDDVVAIAPDTAVGSKVQLVEEKPDKGIRKITVTIAPAA